VEYLEELDDCRLIASGKREEGISFSAGLAAVAAINSCLFGVSTFRRFGYFALAPTPPPW